LYGGIAIGMANDEEPSIKESAVDVDRKKLYKFFVNTTSEETE
jgi:hypothetical protein